MSLASRREFIKIISAAAVSATKLSSAAHGSTIGDDGAPATEVVLNRKPLRRNSFYPLPLTSIRPKGWLLRQLEIQAAGLSGHLDEFWPDVGSESGWLGGKGESWERGPYFLDGLVPLAFTLQDETLIAKAEKWVNWTLEHQQPNGMIGPPGNDDWWPRMVMLKVLTQYQEATAEPRVVPLLRRYFSYQLKELPTRPLTDWGKYRWQDEVACIVWLYNRSGDPDLLRLARILHQQGYNWHAQFENFDYTTKMNAKELGLRKGTRIPERAMQTHGVNNAMALKSSALWWLVSGDDSYRAGVQQQLTTLDSYHGIPIGMFSADEHLAGRNPTQGIELCAVVEQMFSLEQSIAILGDAALGDRLEKVAFNALPASFTDDMWAHQYDQQPNQIRCSLAQRPWTTNGPESNLFGLDPNFGCCTANMHQGWPKLTSHLWMATPSEGIAAVVYAPCVVNTKIRNVRLRIEEKTEYPFDENVSLEIQPDVEVEFPLSLRIPGWAGEASIRVNGNTVESVRAGSFVVINRRWKPGDRVELHFPMKPAVTRGYHNSVVIERGPIVYSLDISTEWKKLKSRGMTSDWEADPKSAWNYALDIKHSAVEGDMKWEGSGQDTGVFSEQGAPIRLKVKGRKLPEWREENGCAGELPESPTISSEALETLTLVPYGAAKLRITAFPELGGPAGGTGGK
jgi:uncharacterized protein